MAIAKIAKIQNIAYLNYRSRSETIGRIEHLSLEIVPTPNNFGNLGNLGNAAKLS
jgi:hypothetical protein